MQLFELEMPDPFRPREILKITAPLPQESGLNFEWAYRARSREPVCRNGLQSILCRRLSTGKTTGTISSDLMWPEEKSGRNGFKACTE